jgi:hypothetical protein
MWDLWWTKWHWGRFSLSTLVSLPIFIPTTAPHIHHHLSSRAGTIGQLVANVSSGLSLTPPHETKLRRRIHSGLFCVAIKGLYTECPKIMHALIKHEKKKKETK